VFLRHRQVPSTALLSYVAELPAADPSGGGGGYSLLDLAQDLATLATSNFRTNRIFVPTLNTLATLVEQGAFASIAEEAQMRQMYVMKRRVWEGPDPVRFQPPDDPRDEHEGRWPVQDDEPGVERHAIVSRFFAAVDWKGDRRLRSRRAVRTVSLLSMDVDRDLASTKLVTFLTHPFARVSSFPFLTIIKKTKLVFFWQVRIATSEALFELGVDDPEAEETLLSTPWGEEDLSAEELKSAATKAVKGVIIT
jgi:hypothetical protein